jgi:hypothetical protein
MRYRWNMQAEQEESFDLLEAELRESSQAERDSS